MHAVSLTQSFRDFIIKRDFPCVAARTAIQKDTMRIMEAKHLGCPADDQAILIHLNAFIKDYRDNHTGFRTAAIIFEGPGDAGEEYFEELFWKRLQALADLDAQINNYDQRVSNDPADGKFSFSLGGEAFFVLGMHSASSRPARKFSHPVLVFNPHQQFVQMKQTGAYDKMKAIVRKREWQFSGSLNPMLADFGERSETFQYSGKEHSANWICPLKTMRKI